MILDWTFLKNWSLLKPPKVDELEEIRNKTFRHRDKRKCFYKFLAYTDRKIKTLGFHFALNYTFKKITFKLQIKITITLKRACNK